MTPVDDGGPPERGCASASTGWKEETEPGEDERVAEFLAVIRRQQMEAAAQKREPLRRGFHAKLHAGFLAEFHVLPGLPECARHGVFSEPRVYAAAVRFSNGAFTVNEDRKHEPRGIGIKLVGVHGPRLGEADPDAVTQDFLATSHSVTSTVRNARQFMAFIEATHRGPLLPVHLARSVGVREAARILAAVVMTVGLSRVRSMATERYGGTAPIQLGPYAVKYIVQPSAGTEPPRRRTRTPDFLRHELAERLQERDLLFDFLVQFYVDRRRTPIEDTSIPWDEKASPPLRVAQLRIPSCDLHQDHVQAQSQAIDRLAFSPWQGLAAHRPLGSVMRARRIAYPASAGLRTHQPEPRHLPL